MTATEPDFPIPLHVLRAASLERMLEPYRARLEAIMDEIAATVHASVPPTTWDVQAWAGHRFFPEARVDPTSQRAIVRAIMVALADAGDQ